jgi:hypothetical protein
MVAKYVALVKTQKGIFLLLNEDHTVKGWETQRKALNYFERAYAAAHKRSYVGSMSACLHSIEFQYSVIPFESVEWLRTNIVSPDPSVLFLSAESGRMHALETRKGVKKFWEKGVQPKLI